MFSGIACALLAQAADPLASAIASFKEALTANPDDRLAQTYIERCEQMKKTPPKGEWDGVWIMTSK